MSVIYTIRHCPAEPRPQHGSMKLLRNLSILKISSSFFSKESYHNFSSNSSPLGVTVTNWLVGKDPHHLKIICALYNYFLFLTEEELNYSSDAGSSSQEVMRGMCLVSEQTTSHA